jgi:asparagine synthase (glutamine-hydrolysing)
MCGLLGVVGKSGLTPAALEQIRGALATLEHRGPDGTRLEIGDDWVLGHTRLAILDLTDMAAQPMPGRRSWIVFNGVIYNFQELREELRSQGVHFRSTGDTEVLLAALEHWGTDALPRLRGMFAFGWLDPRRKQLLLVRDRYGVKPLVWERTQDGVRFASDLFALDKMAGGANQRSIDPEQARLYLLLGNVPAPYTVWKGPRKLLPGHFLRVQWDDDGRRSIEECCYWKIDSISAGVGPPPADAFVTLSQKLDEAIRLRLISDVPVGLLLSGGIDSSLVGAVCSEIPGAEVPSFTMGFNDPDSDERPYARAVGNMLKLAHEDFVIDLNDVVGSFEQLWNIFDEPFADSSALPMVVLCREMRKRVKVGIGGDGGDEVWCGYPWHRAISKLDRLAPFPLPLRRLAAIVIKPFGAKWRYFARVIAARDRLASWGVLRTGLTDRMARYLPVDAEPRPVSESFHDATERIGAITDTLDWASRMDLAMYLPDDLMVKADRASMAVGLELREPLLDHQFTAAGLALPSSARFDKKKQQGKTFARTFLSRRLSAKLIDRPKRGFTPPLHLWLSGPLKSIKERALADLESGALYPLMLPKGVRSWRQCAKALDDVHEQFLWRIICFWGWKTTRLGGSAGGGHS